MGCHHDFFIFRAAGRALRLQLPCGRACLRSVVRGLRSSASTAARPIAPPQGKLPLRSLPQPAHKAGIRKKKNAFPILGKAFLCDSSTGDLRINLYEHGLQVGCPLVGIGTVGNKNHCSPPAGQRGKIGMAL